MAAELLTMTGTLFKYGSKSVQVAFMAGSHNRHVVVIGGLTDGFFPTSYVKPLAAALEGRGWSTVQATFSSSYSGYGTSSLKQDAEELEVLLQCLSLSFSSSDVVLIGHSTGCQDIAHYMREGGPSRSLVRGCVLQAPVSDREYLRTLPDTYPALLAAEIDVEAGRGDVLLPRWATPDGAPITSYRFHSLTARGGDDDMFSSDLSDEVLDFKLSPLGSVPTLIVWSDKDEYVPGHVDTDKLTQRMRHAVGDKARVARIDGNHALSGCEEDMVKEVMLFLGDLDVDT